YTRLFRPAVRAIEVDVAAKHVQEACQRAGALVRRVDTAGNLAGGIVIIEGLVAVLLLDTDHLAGEGVQRLIPGDALELALAALADALHGVLEALGGVHAPDLRATPHARDGTGVVNRVLIGVSVGQQADNRAVLHLSLEDAATTAVVVAACRHDLALGCPGGGLYLLQARSQARSQARTGAACQHSGAAQRSAPLEEAA